MSRVARGSAPPPAGGAAAAAAAASAAAAAARAAVAATELDDDAAEMEEGEYEVLDSEAAAAERAARLDRLLQGTLDEAPDDTSGGSGGGTARRIAFGSSLAVGGGGDGVIATEGEAGSADRASLYSDLHAYLDRLQRQGDLAEGFIDSTDTAITTTASTPANESQQAQPRRTPEPPRTVQTPPGPRGRAVASPRPQSSDAESKEIEPALSPSARRAPPTPGAAILPVSPSTRASRARHSTTIPSRTNQQPHATSTTAAAEEEKRLDGDDAGGGDYDDADMPPIDPDSFDENQEMAKIAQLDALIAEADARSAEMEQRLHALLSAPLPQIAGAGDADASETLLLMPGSPISSPTQAGGLDEDPSGDFSAADGANPNDFFMTSVPGAGGVTDSQDDSQTAVSNPPAADAAAAGADPSIWILEDVEELDAPLVLASGEGFRPSAEDQVKLDEIDALLNHFRSSDSRLPSSYRPRFAHPPMNKKNKKKKQRVGPAAPSTTNNKKSDSTASSDALVTLPDDSDETEEGVADLVSFPDAATLAARVSALVPMSGDGVLDGLGGSLMSLALEGSGDASSLDPLNEDDAREMRRFNRQLQKMQRAAASASNAANSSVTASSAGRSAERPSVDPEQLRRIIAKTQASIAAPASAAAGSAFPTFAFPKSSSSASTSSSSSGATSAFPSSLPSTAAIFAAMEAEEKAQKRKQRAAEAETTRAPAAAMDADTLPRDDDEEYYEEDDVPPAADPDGEEEYFDDHDDDDADGVDDSTSFAVEEEVDVSKNPRERMDRLTAQVAAIRARVCDDGAEYRVDRPPSATATKSRSGVASAGRRSVDGARPVSRPRSQPVPDLDDSFSSFYDSSPSPATAAAAASPIHSRSTSRASPPARSPLYSSSPSPVSGGLSLGDRLDRALGRPTSSSSSSGGGNSARGGIGGGGGESWRTWQPRMDDMAAAAAGGSGARVRAAARGQAQAATLATAGGPSPRMPGSQTTTAGPLRSTAVPQRPLRAIASAAAAAAAQSARGTTALGAAATDRARSRPLSAASTTSTTIDVLPPPISSHALHSRQIQQMSKAMSSTWK